MRPAARPLLPLGSLVVEPKIQECVSDRPLGHEADPQLLLWLQVSFGPRCCGVPRGPRNHLLDQNPEPSAETSELEMEADSGSFIPRTFQSGINPRFGFSPAACQRKSLLTTAPAASVPVLPEGSPPHHYHHQVRAF